MININNAAKLGSPAQQVRLNNQVNTAQQSASANLAKGAEELSLQFSEKEEKRNKLYLSGQDNKYLDFDK